MLRLAVLLALVLAGCRIERYDGERPDTLAAPAAPTENAASPASESLRAVGPPVLPGDTVRVGPPSADPNPPVTTPAPSGLLIPVAGIRASDLVDTFMQARGEGRRHDAIDILAPRGTPVVAAAPGRILRLFTSERGGLTIYQLGADGRTVYYYAHLDAYAPGLAQDQQVMQGQTLGTVGDSGNAVPGNTHLHFAIWTTEDPKSFWDGEPVNPYPLLAGR